MNIVKDFTVADSLRVELENGVVVRLPVIRPKFKIWKGLQVFDYGGKPLLDYKGEVCFAELLIVKLLIDNGLDAVWIETYGGVHYLRSMPNNWKLKTEHIEIPQEKESLLKKIWKKAKTTACFDVLAWNEKNIILLEAKHFKKDNLTKPQIKFIKGAIDCGIDSSNLLIVEWDFEE
ncbi:MAG: hypothetical protein WCS56_05545 [Bacilli bacterium]